MIWIFKVINIGICYAIEFNNIFFVFYRCELLSLESAVLPVDGVSLSTKSFWKFYTKCFRNKAMCVGCFWKVTIATRKKRKAWLLYVCQKVWFFFVFFF